MTQYKYVTVLEAQNDGRKPNDNLEEGDKIVKAGKHKTDSIEYIDDNNDIHVISFEAVATYESDTIMSDSEAQQLAKDRWFSEEE